MTLDRILDCLERRRIRATYGAVGAVIGKPARSVGAALGGRTRRASWVVNAQDGEPTGYRPHQKHPDLHRTPHVIRTGDELRRICTPSRITGGNGPPRIPAPAPRTAPTRTTGSGRGSNALPRLVTHADWSKNPKKRWCATATLDADGHYRIGAPEPVGDLSTYFTRLLNGAGAGADAVVLSGFDFPIGLPKSYADKARITRFRSALPRFGRGGWSDFYRPADTRSTISVTRPFYPTSRGGTRGTRRQHLVAGLGMQDFDELYRRCEEQPGRNRAAVLFWLVGGNQVGEAAITGWRDLLVPGLANQDVSVSIWPFDGDLVKLLKRPGVVVAETYPADVYRHLDLEVRRNKRSKRRQSDRAEDAGTMNAWARTNQVQLTDRLRAEITHGFGESTDGEDRFDAVVGLLGMLDVVLGNSPSGAPDDATTQIEGWILGQPVPAGSPDPDRSVGDV